MLSDLLGIPQITLTDEHNPSCKNVLSMRPDTAQLYHSVMALIKNSQSRIVAVIIEGRLFKSYTAYASNLDWQAKESPFSSKGITIGGIHKGFPHLRGGSG